MQTLHESQQSITILLLKGNNFHLRKTTAVREWNKLYNRFLLIGTHQFYTICADLDAVSIIRGKVNNLSKFGYYVLL